ncbi:ATP-independent RNA helicase DbpA [Filimonas zeae]|uniref:Helicase n=1 Tax=Filimonas zeae TaxID=1737353 RepID=A0A917MVX6_9BACT|nr:DEAD/DEAH box helicase [Filimonas zeae]MDR6338588.1 ATP-independent RNA helicase DbpA [Filimonas zeae]GGH67522.1 helicase [Filimonas zeae]
MQQKKYSIETALAGLKIAALNDMQKASLEANVEHDNILLLSATGSGKTLAFLLPLLEKLDFTTKKTEALIIVPSRELALQIEQVLRSMSTGAKVTCCYGGHLRETEEKNLVEPPSIIVGTPGRLADHIRRGNITIDSIKTLVLDEFDKSLEAGFQDEIAFIIGSLPGIQKRILTSATEAVDVPEFVGFENYFLLNFLNEEGEEQERLAIKKVISEDRDKIETLFKLLCYFGARPTIIFCNHRDAVERTSTLLSERGIYSEFYHGAMEQRDRDSALGKFRNGSVSFLVTTDLAARGLDIPHIRYIIHYHLPATQDIFTHRNGRTARMEASGTAILLLSTEEKVPAYVTEEVEEIELPEELELPERSKWTTFFIAAGKKNKVNKVDIVGFLSNKGQLKKEDIGLIEVKDFFSFVAVRRSKASLTLTLVRNEKIKNQKVKIEIAK